MIIRCPHCAFSRTVEDDKIPSSAQTATCPKCRNKFRFRDPDDVAGKAYPKDGAGYAAAQSLDRDIQDTGCEFGAGVAGQAAGGHEAEHGEDIWDRVASLGESWADDEPDLEAAPGNSFKSGSVRASEHVAAADVPWEQIRDIGLFKAFGQTVLQVLLRPGRFFSDMGVPRKLGLAVVFYLAVTTLQTYVFQAWMQLFPDSSLGLAGSFASAVLPGSSLIIILAAPLVWLLFLMAVTGLSVLILRLVSGRATPLAAVIRLMAYSSAPMLLGIIPFIGAVSGQVWAMVLFLFGCKRAFRLKFSAAVVILLPVYLCLAVLRIVLSGSF